MIKKRIKRETITMTSVSLMLSNTTSMKTSLIKNHALSSEIRPDLSSSMMRAHLLATICVPGHSEWHEEIMWPKPLCRCMHLRMNLLNIKSIVLVTRWPKNRRKKAPRTRETEMSQLIWAGTSYTKWDKNQSSSLFETLIRYWHSRACLTNLGDYGFGIL